jgi:hypothetical protein
VQQAEPLLAALCKIDVTVDDTHVTTDAELTLQVLRGQAGVWKLQIPPLPQTTLEPLGSDERAPIIDRPADPKNPVWTVRLKEPSAEPVPLRIRTYQPRAAGKAAAIGPFVVLGAVRQQGTIKVTAPPALRLRYKTRGIDQRDVTEEQRRGNTVALFSYFSLPQPAKDVQLVPAPLEIEVETVKGAVETSVNHTLRLMPEGWAVTSEIDVRAERTEVERLEFEVPTDYELKAAPATLVEPDLEIKEIGPGKRIGIVRLTPRRSGQFKVVLMGTAPLPKESRSVIALPRPYQTIDHGGGVVKVSVPDDKELLIARESGLLTLPPGQRSHSFTADRAPARVEVDWREYRPELPIDMLVDLTMAEQQVRVRQQLKFRFPLDSMRQVTLKASAGLNDRAPFADGAALTRQGPGTWTTPLKESALSLEFSFKPDPDKTGSFLVPLLWPEGITHCQTKVRIWSEAGSQPILTGRTWEELPLEIVPDRDSLPALVLRASGVNVPLRLKDQPISSLPTIAVDRALIEATVSDGGHQTYRARFLLGKLGTHFLDVELPGPPAGVNLELFLDGKRVSGVQTIDEEGSPVEGGKIVRVRVEPEWYRKPVVLDLRYQLTPGRSESSRLETRFLPPRLRGNVFPGRVRWHMGLPADWVAVHVGGQTTLEQRWGFRAWLPAPRSAVTAPELERWFSASPDPAPAEANLGLGSRNSELVCWQANLAPVTVAHLSEQTWLLTCSLAILVIGLGLYLLAALPRVFGATVVVLGLAVVLIGILWPSVLPVIAYGCEPGAVVLLLVVSFLWIRQHRYRRQLVFMPGFSRLGPGSSVMHAGSSHRPRGEPSTVDAPLGASALLGGQMPTDAPGSRHDLGGSRQEAVPRNP